MQTRAPGILIVLITVAGMGMAPRAHAEEAGALVGGAPSAEAPATGAVPALAVSATTAPRAEYQRYWKQSLVIDAASLAVFVTAVAAGELTEGSVVPEAVGSAAVLSYLLGSPILHIAHHGNMNRAVLSALLRGGLPVAGLIAGARVAPCHRSDYPGGFCGLSEALLGMAVGVGAAVAIDYTWLARKRIERVPARGLSIVPSMSARRDGFAFGLAGSF